MKTYYFYINNKQVGSVQGTGIAAEAWLSLKKFGELANITILLVDGETGEILDENLAEQEE